MVKDLQRKVELGTKNMGSENRSLRSRLLQVEKENEALKTSLGEAETQIKVQL